MNPFILVSVSFLLGAALVVFVVRRRVGHRPSVEVHDDYWNSGHKPAADLIPTRDWFEAEEGCYRPVLAARHEGCWVYVSSGDELHLFKADTIVGWMGEGAVAEARESARP